MTDHLTLWSVCNNHVCSPGPDDDVWGLWPLDVYARTPADLVPVLVPYFAGLDDLIQAGGPAGSSTRLLYCEDCANLINRYNPDLCRTYAYGDEHAT